METLKAWIRARPLEPRDAIGWVVRIARAVEALHELDVPHGRITAEAVRCAAPSANAKAELLDADDVPRDVRYYCTRRCKLSGSSKEDDVWALGVLLYYAVTGALPFEGDNRRQVRERIEWRPASPLDVFGVDHQGLQPLLDRVFKRDESLRLVTLATLIDTLIALQPTAAALPELDFGVAHGDEVKLELHSWAREEPEAPPLSPGPMRTLQLTNLDDDPLAALGDESPAPKAPESAAAPAKPVPAKAAELVPEPLEPLRDDSSHDVGDDDTVVMSRRAKAPPALRPRVPPAAGAPPPLPAKPAEPTPEPAREPAWERVDVMATERTPSSAGSARPSRPRSRTPLATLPAKSRRMVWLVAVLLVCLGGLAAVIVLPELRARRSTPTPPSPKPAATVPPSASVPAETSASAPEPAAPSASTTATATAALPELSTCVIDMFEPGTFASTTMPPRFLFICVEKDPRKAADALRTEVVLGKGERMVTPAMRMFSELGWYEMAFVAAARAQCCERPVPIRSVVPGAPCDYDVALTALGEAAAHGDDELFKSSLARYSKAAHCIASMGSARAYGQAGMPRGGEAPTFMKAMVFVRTARQAQQRR